MSKAKHTSRRTSADARPPVAAVRMYDVGFGDCFLLKLRTRGGPRKVLIDCGTFGGLPTKRTMKDIVGDVIEDLKEGEPGGVARADVVVVTHRHKDHVSGFGDPRWDAVEVREVWMPWTEHPTEPAAVRVRTAQTRLAAALTAAAAAAPVLGMHTDLLSLNAASDSRPMNTLYKGFATPAERKYLPKDDEERTYETDVLPGVVVHVLGPPHNEKVIRDMDPPAGQSYLRMARTAVDADGAPEPFPSRWASRSTRELKALLNGDETRIKTLGAEAGLAALAALDKAVNGTSLVLVFQIGDAHLLFPGDAQWGTWEAALDDPEWKELLAKVTFLKVGHHASHNATPKRFVEDVMKAGIPAMAPVRPIGTFPSIPRQKLVAALRKKKANLVLTGDLDGKLPRGYVAAADKRYVEIEIPSS